MVALKNGAPNSLVQSLLQSGADPHHRIDDGRAVLHFALMGPNVVAIKWLVAENVDVCIRLVQYLLGYCERNLTVKFRGDISRVLNSFRAMNVLTLVGTNHIGNSFSIKQTQAQLIERLNSFIPKSIDLESKTPRFRADETAGGDLREIRDIVHELIDMLSNPLSLKHICRVQIRKSLGGDFHRKLHQVNVPLPLQEYLMVYKPVSSFEHDIPMTS